MEEAEIVEETPAPSDDIDSDEAVDETRDVEAEPEVALTQDEAAAPSTPDETFEESNEPGKNFDDEIPSFEATQTDEKTVVPPPPSPSFAAKVIPLVIGGMLAAALGYLVPIYILPKEDATAPLVAQIERLQDRINTLSTNQSEIEFPDITPLSMSIETLGKQLDSLETRIATLETLPIENNTIDTSELQQLRATLSAQKAESAELSAELQRLASVQQSQIRDAETQALEAARNTADAAARQTLQASLSNGEPYAHVLNSLSKPLPEVAQATAEQGIPTAESLTEPFDALARRALILAHEENAQAGPLPERLMAFMQAQVGARSVTPRDGEDTDAILSRAQAAALADDFTTAVQEIETLADAPRAVFTDWLEAAKHRATVTTAILDYLSDT